MTRRSIEETRRFHLFLYQSDLEYLERRFGAGAPSASRLGVGTACREIIHARVKALKAKEAERFTQLMQAQHKQANRREEDLEDEATTI